MKADPSAQARLLALQEVDTAIAQLRHRKQTLPQIEQIKGARSKWEQVSEDYIKAETLHSDAERATARAEADLAPVRERLARNQERVDTGQVPDAKALKAMVDELAHLKQRISDLEDNQLQAMEELEDSASELERVATERKRLHAEIKQLMTERDDLAKDIDADVAIRETERATIAVDIPDDLLAAYDKTAARLGGLGVAKLLDRRCTACGLQASTADMTRYETAPANDVLRCEECGRILVRPQH